MALGGGDHHTRAASATAIRGGEGRDATFQTAVSTDTSVTAQLDEGIEHALNDVLRLRAVDEARDGVVEYVLAVRRI